MEEYIMYTITLNFSKYIKEQGWNFVEAENSGYLYLDADTAK